MWEDTDKPERNGDVITKKKAIDRGIPSSFQSCWIHIYRIAIEMVYKWSLNIN